MLQIIVLGNLSAEKRRGGGELLTHVWPLLEHEKDPNSPCEYEAGILVELCLGNKGRRRR